MSKLQFPRVLRGGSYSNGTGSLRATDRVRNGPEFRIRYNGFRLVVRRRKR